MGLFKKGDKAAKASPEDVNREMSISSDEPRLADSHRDPFGTPMATPGVSRPESLSDSIAPNPFASGVSTPTGNNAFSGISSPSWSSQGSLYGSRAGSIIGARSGFQYGDIPGTVYFRSRRIVKGEVPHPALPKKTRKDNLGWILPTGGFLIGLGLMGVCIWYQLWYHVDRHSYCPLIEENFASGKIDPALWNQEVQLGGFGVGDFAQTTADGTNAFVKDGQLVIKPSLTDATLLTTNNVINLTADGTCTSTTWSDCWTSTNTTNGTIVPPVRSARLNTKGKAQIKYGKVEVKAKLPLGDWLWPAIWMMPANDNYGAWPASGEIDIMESRGNNYSYSLGGANFASSTLHWGPTMNTDAYKTTTGERSTVHGYWADQFHVYGLVWNEKYIFTYFDSQLSQVYYWNWPSTGLWAKGNFQATTTNGSTIGNPWTSGTNAAPFDQEFYLILNVAVGGTNGFFLDGADSKPWTNASPYAKSEFARAESQWGPTWKDSKAQMTIDTVKIWKLGSC